MSDKPKKPYPAGPSYDRAREIARGGERLGNSSIVQDTQERYIPVYGFIQGAGSVLVAKIFVSPTGVARREEVPYKPPKVKKGQGQGPGRKRGKTK